MSGHHARDVLLEPDDLTPERVGAALGRVVRSIEREPIGTGQMGSSWRLQLAYDGEPGPATLVAKLANGDAEGRARMAMGFRKEVGFYEHLAATLDARVPGCSYCAITEDGCGFTLLLEDLTPARPRMQIESCSVEQATSAVRNLAALHAARWNDPSLRGFDFLTPMGEGAAELLAAVLADAMESFIDRYADVLGDDDKATLRDAAAALAPWLDDRQEPFAILHGDYRLENLMFPPDDGPVAALDWQSVSVGPPGRDLAYFIGTTFDGPDRRRHEDGLVAAYHAELIDRGVAGYDLAHCTEDYRAGHLQGPLITVLGCIYATAARSDSADAMFVSMASRSCSAIRDLGTLDLIARED